MDNYFALLCAADYSTLVMTGIDINFTLCLSPLVVLPKGLLPIKIYLNADVEKLEIYKENKGKSGIYIWENKINGNRYIGSSVHLSRRFKSYYNSSHLLKYTNMTIYKALLKYGHSNFSLSIFEYCEPDKCIEREQYYIDFFKPEYNILQTAGSSLGYKHSEEAIEKIITAKTGLRRSPEALAKFVASVMGRKSPMEGKTFRVNEKCLKLKKEKIIQYIRKSGLLYQVVPLKE